MVYDLELKVMNGDRRLIKILTKEKGAIYL